MSEGRQKYVWLPHPPSFQGKVLLSELKNFCRKLWVLFQTSNSNKLINIQSVSLVSIVFYHGITQYEVHRLNLSALLFAVSKFLALSNEYRKMPKYKGNTFFFTKYSISTQYLHCLILVAILAFVSFIQESLKNCSH